MAQYQSFPGTTGDSRTLDKLKALALPEMAGRTFLDVGCNEGFFCGYARYQGAARSVGVDASGPFVERARARFPDCEFHHGSWDVLPAGPFDTILLASALHYASDQEALIHRLAAELTPDGVLVLEMGIVSSRDNAWIQVRRGIDERAFPSMAKLREVLTGYAWKWMGPSVQQGGDPVRRHVVHVRRRLPVAYLMMEPPGYGKSTIAASLFGQQAIPVVSCDSLLSAISRGEVRAAGALHALIDAEFSPFTLDRLVAAIHDAGLGGDLVDCWCEAAGHGDFAADAYVPAAHQTAVMDALRTRGYLPVQLSWDRVGMAPMARDVMEAQAERFYFSLAPEMAPAQWAAATLPASVMGAVDEVCQAEDRIQVRGWALMPSGQMPALLVVRHGGRTRHFTGYRKQQRPDVQAHFALPHDLYGYILDLVDDGGGLAAWSDLVVMGGDSEDALSPAFPVAGGAVDDTGDEAASAALPSVAVKAEVETTQGGNP